MIIIWVLIPAFAVAVGAGVYWDLVVAPTSAADVRRELDSLANLSRSTTFYAEHLGAGDIIAPFTGPYETSLYESAIGIAGTLETTHYAADEASEGLRGAAYARRLSLVLSRHIRNPDPEAHAPILAREAARLTQEIEALLDEG